MKNVMLALTALACLVALVIPATGQQQITPPAPIPLPASAVKTTINNGPGDQLDPHVSGDLTTYTDGIEPSIVRYYRFSTGVDQAISSPLDASDRLSDVSGKLVSFSRSLGGCNATMVFDPTSGTTSEIAPQACPQRVSTALGNTTVAFVEFEGSPSVGNVFVADTSGTPATQLSSGTGTSQNP